MRSTIADPDVSVRGMTYAHLVKRLQILIDEDLDAELERLAAETGTSKAALIRQFVRDRLRPLPPLSADPIGRMAGSDSFEPASVDDVVYG
jgi:Ribbon-helix-helix protein, copG family